MKHVKNFLVRGLMASTGGVIILMIVYAVLDAQGVIGALTAGQVIREVLTVCLMAFIAGGVSVVHNLERLPQMAAAFIHAAVLYVDYLVIYLYNGWLPDTPGIVLGFTAIFLALYLVVWVIVWLCIRRSVKRANLNLM